MAKQPNFRFHFHTVYHDGLTRLSKLVNAIQQTSCIYALFTAAPKVVGAQKSPIFTAAPSNETYVSESLEQALGWFNFDTWHDRGRQIRSGGNNDFCAGNLTVALHNLGTLSAAEYNGAAGALSLLPTAGALVGSPTGELWRVYKLMPLAGILTMFLSLGGTIIPTQAGDYDQRDLTIYEGMVRPNIRERVILPDSHSVSELSDAEKFAKRIQIRAQDESGGGIYAKVWIATFVQASLVGVILVTLWYGQIGGVVLWVCTIWGWMYCWYVLVVITSIWENHANVPFSENWTLRISRAPGTIRISEEAPLVSRERGPGGTLAALRSGFNAKSKVTISNTDPWTVPKVCFYAIVSVRGISPLHAVMRIMAKWSSIAVFGFGTALFASAQLMSISVVLMVLSLVLGSAALGRVIAMYIASQMSLDNEPVLHTAVRTAQEAEEHIRRILEIDNLVIETKGHVIINNRCIHRRSEWFNLAKYIGLLAPPFDVTKIAMGVDGALQRNRVFIASESAKSGADMGSSVPMLSAPTVSEENQM